jgi:hypothetical protein
MGGGSTMLNLWTDDGTDLAPKNTRGVQVIGTTNPLINLDPSSTGSQNVIDITPSTAITTNEAEWDGIYLNGAALDPSGDDVTIHGLHIDLSGVAAGTNTHIDGVEIQVPLLGDHVLHFENGHVAHNVTVPATAAAEFTGYDVVIDSSSMNAASTMHFFDVSTTGTPAGILCALGTHANIAPVCQALATYTSPSQTEYAGRRTTGGTVWADGIDTNECFIVNSDEVLIGATAQFSELEVIMGTAGTKSISPAFYYNTAADTWTQFYPSDDTDGFQQSGVIRWTLADISGTWTNDGDPGAGDSSAGYWIRIVRTAAPDPGTPTPTTIKTGVGSTYSWNASGDLSVKAATFTLGATDKVLIEGDTTRTGTTPVLDIDATIDTTTATNDVVVTQSTVTRAAGDTGGTYNYSSTLATGNMQNGEWSAIYQGSYDTGNCATATANAAVFYMLEEI